MSSDRLVARIQGVYWLVTGVWPIVHLDSFEWVTGPKVDDWLVRTIGALIAAVGVTLLTAARSEQVGKDAARLALLSALALGVADVVAPLAAGVRWVYFLDAPVQAAFVVYWGWYLARGPVAAPTPAGRGRATKRPPSRS